MLTVATLLYDYFGDFTSVWNGTFESAVPVFIGSLIVAAFLVAAGHVRIALFHAPEVEVESPAMDERDKSIDTLRSSNGHDVIVAGY